VNDKVTGLNEMLMDALTRDLTDPDKCTPGLYTVVRGIINDNRDALDSIPSKALEETLKSMTNSVPFKIKESAY